MLAFPGGRIPAQRLPRSASVRRLRSLSGLRPWSRGRGLARLLGACPPEVFWGCGRTTEDGAAHPPTHRPTLPARGKRRFGCLV